MNKIPLTGDKIFVLKKQQKKKKALWLQEHTIHKKANKQNFD